MDLVDKIFYINLSRRTDRNQHFLDECKKVNIPVNKIERFEAIDGNTYNFSKRELQMFNNCDFKGRNFEKKIYGNQLSHYYIFKEMIEKSYEYIIVCQDDVVFKENFLNYLNKLMQNIPENAEMINIGLHKVGSYSYFVPWDLTQEDNINDYGTIINNNDNICKLKRGINPCSLAYILTLKGAKNFVSYFKEKGFLRATDGNFNDYLELKDIFYGSIPVLCTGNPSLGSDIFSQT